MKYYCIACGDRDVDLDHARTCAHTPPTYGTSGLTPEPSEFEFKGESLQFEGAPAARLDEHWRRVTRVDEDERRFVREVAADMRGRVAVRMPPTDLKEAERLLALWHPVIDALAGWLDDDAEAEDVSMGALAVALTYKSRLERDGWLS